MSCDFACSHETPNVEFRVKAAKRKGALGLLSKVKHLSMVSIPAEKIKEEKIVEGWFPLTDYNAAPDEDEESDSDDSDKEKDREHGELQLRIEFTPIEEVCESLSTVALPNAYYEARQGCNVTLYQNAEVTPNTLPTIPFAPEFKHSRCWVDIAHAIMASPKFVYITGWAVWPDLVPVRTEGDLFCGMTLGEMLKQKAEEGVTVRVLVWDELASNMFSDGLMVTHVRVVHSFDALRAFA